MESVMCAYDLTPDKTHGSATGRSTYEDNSYNDLCDWCGKREDEVAYWKPFTSKNEQTATLATMSAKERKESPLFRGLFKYFPDALVEIAHVSWLGNEQHHPGQPLHWDKTKSTDEGDALLRHQVQAGTRDTDGARHSAKVAWRALAQLQREIEGESK